MGQSWRNPEKPPGRFFCHAKCRQRKASNAEAEKDYRALKPVHALKQIHVLTSLLALPLGPRYNAGEEGIQ